MAVRDKSDFISRIPATAAPSDWGLAAGQQIPITIIQRLVTDIVDSLLNGGSLSSGQIPMKSGTDGVAEASALTQGASDINSTMPLGLRGDSAFRIGGISAVGRASTISFQDETRFHSGSPRMFGPVIHETTAGLVAGPFYFKPQDTFTTTAALAGTTETITGTTHQFVIQNQNLGTVLEYRDIQRSGGSSEIAGANITIRRNSHSDLTPVFDYKRDIAGGAGFTLAASGTTVIDLTREQLFLEDELLYITITGDGAAALNLLGETINVPGAGSQLVPHVDSYGRLGVITFTEDALGNPSTDGFVLSSTTAGARSWIDPATSFTLTVQDEGVALATSATALNFVGAGVTVTGTGATKTITINGGDPTPQPGPADLRYGLSSESNPASVTWAGLTDVASPTDPQTVSTGTTTAGQYFHIFSASTHDIQTITDTVLNQIVYQDGGTGNIFTKVSAVRTESSVIYDAYSVGPLNAGVSEDYVLRFS